MSTLGRLVKKFQNKENINQNIFVVTLYRDAALAAAADDILVYKVPFDCRLIAATMQLENSGGTGGATTLSIETLTQTTDMTGGVLTLTQAGGDFKNVSTDISATTFDSYEIYGGETLSVCLDAVATDTDSNGLLVTLTFATI